MKTPKVSVFLQTYDQAQYLGQSIESLLSQTLQDFELLIVDDCSPDDTQEVLQRYNSDHRITQIRNPRNLGQHLSTNLHSQRLQGEFVVFASGDDVYLPELFEAEVSVLEKHSSVGLVHVDGYIIDATGNRKHLISDRYSGTFRALSLNGYVMRGLDFFKLLLKANLIASHSTCMLRRECLEKVGSFDESLPQLGDWDMWMRIALNYDVAYISEPLVCWREHDQSASARMRAAGRSKENRVKLAMKLLSEYPGFARKMAQSEPAVLDWGFLNPAWHACKTGDVSLMHWRLDKGAVFSPNISEASNRLHPQSYTLLGNGLTLKLSVPRYALFSTM